MRAADARDIASNRAGDEWQTVANAHAMLARSCGLNWPTLAVVARASASNRVGDAWPRVVNAHAVLARFCG
eukprot:6201911-Pleurochrysis_carterae.AAC.1